MFRPPRTAGSRKSRCSSARSSSRHGRNTMRGVSTAMALGLARRLTWAAYSGDLDDARLDGLEAIGYLRIVAGHDQLRRAGEAVDRVEGREHLGQARDDLHGLPRLDVVIEVRRVGREDRKSTR